VWEGEVRWGLQELLWIAGIAWITHDMILSGFVWIGPGADCPIGLMLQRPPHEIG